MVCFGRWRLAFIKIVSLLVRRWHINMEIKKDTQENEATCMLVTASMATMPWGTLNVSQPLELLWIGFKSKIPRSNVQAFHSTLAGLKGSHFRKPEGFLFWENPGSQWSLKLSLFCNSWLRDQWGSTTEVFLNIFCKAKRFKVRLQVCVVLVPQAGCLGPTGSFPYLWNQEPALAHCQVPQ